MRTLLNSILLLVVAIIICVLLIPVTIIWTVGYLFLSGKFSQAEIKLADYLRTIALALDQLGNVALEYPLNKLMTNNGYQFGNREDTISYALGRNQIDGTLTKSGWVLVNILNLIQKNHCLIAVKLKS
jgi:8-oxo-dGTP diphosphatase